ncbi:hypothetical protein F5884DRAFT_774707 [Xylogone sp. PMI_703]|nr:hypothetical protein F5884DRAFT_774707 [Xylogone sp. PMI_703]
MASKPTLIFLPGAWHSPKVYDTIIEKLTKLGYKSRTLPLQAVEQQEAVKDLQPDIDALREAILSELDGAESDVVVCSHSWSGIITQGALDGLDKASRAKEGKKTSVVKIAFFCAFVPLEGVSLLDAFGGVENMKQVANIDEPWIFPRDPTNMFYNDLPEDQQKYWVSTLRPHSFATKGIGSKSCAWRFIPSRYLLCENDNAIPLPLQEAMVKECQDNGAEMETERIASSHSPFLSHPDEFVAFIRRTAGENL